MTNEQLAVLIKQGEQERTPELWENVRKLLYKLSFHQYTAHADLFKQQGLSLEDIQQESYFAMLGAVEAYNPERNSVIRILTIYARCTSSRSTWI